MQGVAQFFGAPAISQTLDRLSYGEPLTTGAGGLGGTTRIRPEAIESAMTVAPLVGPTARITKGLPVGMSIKSIDELAAKYPGVKIDAFVTKDNLNLSRIVVPKEMRNQGLGTQVMNDLSEYADNIGKRITLTPSSDFGGNVKRLKEFYKDFGFVENKGKNKDFSTSETMYREPKPIDQTTESFQAPQGEALRLAQQRAALPVEQGGLGLGPNNTAAERAAAMGFDLDTNYIHMTNAPFDSINKTGRFPGVFSLPNESATGYGSTSMPFYLSGVPARSRDLQDYTAKTIKSVTGSSGKKATQKIEDAIEQTVPEKYWNDPGDMADAFEEMQKTRMKLAAELNFPAVKMADEFNESTVALLPGDGVRSRFAAFDPFRKTAATAATMGVAAPDLLAQEQPNVSEAQQRAMIMRDIGTDPYTIYQQTGIWFGGNE
jgi:hypothetical protein